MKTKSLTFLFITVWGYCAHASDGSYLNVTSTAMLCPYGQYRIGNTCVDMSFQSPDCKSITVGNKTYGTSLLNLNLDTFRHQEYDIEYPCYGMYSLYTIGSTANTDRLLMPAKSGGLYYETITSMATICPYGQYHLNGKCVTQNSVTASDNACNCTTDPTTGQQTCDNMTVAEQASFMAVDKESPEECLGTYSKYAHSSATTADNRIYPLFNGTYLSIGTKIDVFDKMLTTSPCQFNSDDYYSINLLSDKTSDSFMHPALGMCDTAQGYQKFIVDTDCKDITNDAQINQNRICGVLCENSGEVYTNSGVCSTNGYCMNGDKKMRLHVARPDGEKYSYPLYASKTSTPALNFKFLDKVTNVEKMCYVNLVPPDAINHFVGVKPNPIRVGKSLDWTDSAGAHTTTNLITID